MKYKISGTIELNWSAEIEADSEDEAIQKAKDYAYDGNGLDIPVGEPEVHDVNLVEGA